MKVFWFILYSLFLFMAGSGVHYQLVELMEIPKSEFPEPSWLSVVSGLVGCFFLGLMTYER